MGAVARRTGPDQHAALLIDRQALAVDEFVLEILQRRVIELELPLEGAIGQAAPLAQQGDHLIHDRDKVHPVSSLPVLCLRAHARLHHSIGDREDAGGRADYL